MLERNKKLYEDSLKEKDKDLEDHILELSYSDLVQTQDW